MKNNIKIIIGFLIIVFGYTFLPSCNVINPKEEIPTFIQVDSVTLSDNAAIEEGTLSHKIVDIWAYSNNQLLGAFQVPARIPVLGSDNKNISLVAGVWENGLSGNREKYGFLTIDTLTLQTQPATTVKHVAKYQYRDNITVVQNEDFEQGNSFIFKDGDTTLVKTYTSNEVFEGLSSGKIYLHDSIKTSKIISASSFSLTAGNQSFLEINYKSDFPFSVLLETYFNTNYLTETLVGVNAKNYWNKMYIKLSDKPIQFPGATFKILFSMALPDGVTKGNFYIDNVKIVSL